MRLRIVAFCLSGIVALWLDWWEQVGLLFEIEVAIVRGMVGLWTIELITRLGRATIDAVKREGTLSELVDRLTSTLTSGVSLYTLFSVWVGSVAILDGMFNAQPYRMLASFLKVGSAFTVSLWLLLNILTFVGGSRRKAHEFLETLKQLGTRAKDGDLTDATEPVKDYKPRP
jgi:hypothetical protein